MGRQFFIAGILLSCYIYCSYGEPTLEKIAVVFRHGERSTLYEGTQKAIESLQLTNAGKMQGFMFGKWLREKYPTLLRRHYDNEEIYAQSSKVTRCIMTTQTVLAGLYYPLDWLDQWSGDFNINWTPIPVNSYDENLDHMLYPFRAASCPKLNEIAKETLDYTGTTYPHIADLIDKNNSRNNIDRLIKTFLNGYFSTPEGKKIATDVLEHISIETPSNRLYTGMLLKDILTEFDNGTRKMTIYGGHESTIISLLYGMELMKPQKVPYLSAVIFELYFDEENWRHFIKVLYLNGENIRTLKLDDCDEFCPREEFEKKIKHLIPVDIEKECQADSTSAE